VVVEREHAAGRVVARAAKTPHLGAIDGLRGIAVLLVMWYHYWQITWLPADVHLSFTTANFNVFPETGSAGVDLFYFVSGFCLFLPYARTLFDGAPRQSIRTFAYRRVLKIVPSYYLAIALMIALGFAHFDSHDDAVRQIFAHLGFVQNVWSQTWGGIDGVMWSLATEVQFYVVFPAICWCAMRRPLVTFALLIALGDAYRFFVVAHSSLIVYDIDKLPGAIDLFASGMLAAWAYRAIAVRAPKLAARRTLWTSLALVGSFACYALLAYQFGRRYDDGWLYTWKATFRPCFDLALLPVTLGSLLGFSWWRRVLGNPVMTFLSLISYNLYLWHQPLALALFARRPLPYHGSDPKQDHLWGLEFMALAALVSIAVAWAITRFFEQPILQRRPFADFRFAPRLRRRPAGNAP
jgi:peptidoglycan/LPS O-acetylase OafA/YrhL